MPLMHAGRKIYPVLPAHALHYHLGDKLRVRYGERVTMLCGTELTVGIGARRVPEREWSSLHDSLRCQRCVRSYEST